MARGNTVEVKFAGEASGFNRVVKQVADNSEEAGGRMKRSFDKAGEAADSSESKFMGMADILDGLGGAFGIPTEGATNMMRSFGDLSGGFAILQPAIGGVTTSMKAMGMSMLTNPIFLVVAVVAALAAAFYLAYTKSETFRDIVDNALRVVSAGFQWLWGMAQGVFNWIGDNWKTLAFTIAAPIALAVAVVSSHWDKIIVGVRFVGDVIAAVFQGAWGTIKTIFNAIAWAWNNTIGKLSIQVPDIPGLPFRGQRFNVPDIPTLHSGGVFQAPGGAREGLALLESGETVLPRGQGGGGSNVTINFNGVTTREAADQVVKVLDLHFGRGGALSNGRGGTLA
ncbi:MAG: hypothetical protein M3Q68_06840, partial [Actinomycetota bacterium]|nr:hypothetical protein [Actinomycetota bacterium]